MKKFTGVLLSLLIVFAIWLFLRNKEAEPADHDKSPTGGSQVSDSLDPKNEASKDNLQQLQELAISGNLSLDFWGLVLDESRMPITNAIVSVEVRSVEISQAGMPSDRTEHLKLKTNTFGRFSVIGKTGTMLRIVSIEKDGYWYPNKQLDTFDSNRGDLGNVTQQEPQEFFVIQDKERNLFTASHRMIIKWEEKGAIFDVRDGKDGKNADLVFSVHKGVCEGNRCDWTFKIESIENILVEAQKYSSSIAPDEGYQSEWTMHFRNNESQYSDGFKKSFHLRLSDGKYALIRLSAYIDTRSDGVRIFVDSIVNESGDQILASRRK